MAHDEVMLDGNCRLNLATFVGTWMEREASQLYAETFDKNMIDKDEYPQTALIETGAGPYLHLRTNYARLMEMRGSTAKPGSAGKLSLWQQRTWLWIVAAGLDVYILGVVIGLQPAGPLCGSPLIPTSRAAELVDLEQAGIGAAATCYRNIDAESIPVWSLIALGVVLVLVGVAARIINIRRHAASADAGNAA